MSPNVDHEQDMEQNGAHPVATRVVYLALIILLVVLFLFLGPGLHRPTGG